MAYYEIHLFTDFGRSFRKEFQLLRNAIPNNVRKILMTATCNQSIANSIEDMLKLKVTKYFWGNNKEQRMRKVSINVTCITRPLEKVFNSITETLVGNEKKNSGICK